MSELKNQLLEDMLGKLEVGKLDEGYNFVFNVKRNAVGELFIAMLRKALNKSKYSIRVRGSQADRKGKRESGFHVTDSNVPLEHADRYRVYIDGIKTEAYASLDSVKNELAETQTLARFYQGKFEKERKSYIDLHKRYQSESEGFLNKIHELNKQIVALKKVTSGEEMQPFAIACDDSLMKEMMQKLALDRGYRWNNVDPYISARVNINAQKYLIITTNSDNEVRMFHGADLGDDNTLLYASMGDFAEALNKNLKHLVTAEEKVMVAEGRLLQAVKSVKDRTGLWLKECKAIIDCYRS